MRYTPEQKQQTAANILKAAGREFRLGGYGGAGIDALAQQAGVTSGAFYKHFPSKAAVFEAAIAAGLDDLRLSILRLMEQHREHWLEAFVDYYFSREHRTDLACGCAVPGLTAEVARSSASAHQIYQHGLNQVLSVMETGLTQIPVAQRSQRALAILSMLSGAVQMMRAIDDEVQAQAYVNMMRESVLRLARA